MECAACHASLPDDALFCLRCGARAPDHSKPEPEDPIRAALRKALGQQYEIQHLLGKGGMGAVYLATEAALEREVAIKVLPPDRGATKDSRDRFRREARTAAKLSHPNIVPLYTFGDVDGTLYFVMGYVKGESLAARLKREGRLAVEESRRILIELCDALDYAHKLGIVHRDIKPDNVLIEEGTGRAMLMDFGVAKALGAGQTMTEVGSVLGTPQYMSPEQAQGKSDIDHRSDLYSLGVMGYAMLAGRLPFEGPTGADIMVQHITREAPALKSLAPEIPTEIAASLTRCLVKDRDTRWPDARSLKDAIAVSDDGGMPEDMIELRRETGAVALGLYLSALVGLHLVSRSGDRDPASFQPPWEIVFFGTAFGAMVWVYMVTQRRRDGSSWREILGFAFTKPSWWVGWYPRRFRLAGDVWSRLPADLRRARAAFWAFIVFFVALMPEQMILFNSWDDYRRTGVKGPLEMFFENVPKGLSKAFTATAALAILAIFVTILLSASRLRRSIALTRTSPRVLNAMFFQDTARRVFWSKPEVAVLLLPESRDPGRGKGAPTSARELASAIATDVSPLTGDARVLGERARDLALDLAGSVAGLDGQIASLETAADPAEAGRLVAKLSALGSPIPSEGEEKRQMRDLFQKQLDLLRGLGTRVDALKAARAGRIEWLKALWLQAVELRAATGDAGRTNRATGRMRTLCAEIAQQLGPSSVTRRFVDEATEAISDAPTIERN